MPMKADRALARALAQAFGEHGATLALEAMSSRPWASATFSGAQHVVTLRVTGPQAEAAANAILPDIGEREFALPGHVLIDIACDAEARVDGEVLLTLAALTIEAD